MWGPGIRAAVHVDRISCITYNQKPKLRRATTRETDPLFPFRISLPPPPLGFSASFGGRSMWLLLVIT